MTRDFRVARGATSSVVAIRFFFQLLLFLIGELLLEGALSIDLPFAVGAMYGLIYFKL